MSRPERALRADQRLERGERGGSWERSPEAAQTWRTGRPDSQQGCAWSPAGSRAYRGRKESLKEGSWGLAGRGAGLEHQEAHTQETHLS